MSAIDINSEPIEQCFTDSIAGRPQTGGFKKRNFTRTPLTANNPNAATTLFFRLVFLIRQIDSLM
jgi:hypothetical protein